jgi:hypothetical protein
MVASSWLTRVLVFAQGGRSKKRKRAGAPQQAQVSDFLVSGYTMLATFS